MGVRSLSVNLPQHSIQVPPAGFDLMLWLAPCSEVQATALAGDSLKSVWPAVTLCVEVAPASPSSLQGYEFKVYPSSCAFLTYANLRTTSASPEERSRAVHSFTGALLGWQLSFAANEGLDFGALYRLRPSLPRPYRPSHPSQTVTCSAACHVASPNVDSSSRVKGLRPYHWNELSELKGASSGESLDRSDRWHCPFEAKKRPNPRVQQAPSLRQPSRFRA